MFIIKFLIETDWQSYSRRQHLRRAGITLLQNYKDGGIHRAIHKLVLKGLTSYCDIFINQPFASSINSSIVVFKSKAKKAIF